MNDAKKNYTQSPDYARLKAKFPLCRKSGDLLLVKEN
jgi:hypothetical protein